MRSESVLAVRARERPESPFVFFRGRRGHFRWLSYAAAHAGKGLAPDGAQWAPPEVHELVQFAAGLEMESAGRDDPFQSPPPGRDVWISWRPLARPAEAALAAAAVRSGVAIVVERRETYPVDLFLWARPTVVSAPIAELFSILGGVDAGKPRFRRATWLRQKLGRLRLVLVESDAGPTGIDRLAAELRRLCPDAGAVVRASTVAAGPSAPALV